ncbi:hypothetical protein KQ874_02320 [Mycoplasma sp. ES3157-GEN-MYC]|uniref:Uncharacterized protein n=1 Tax=Mycoplasma miroungigenitalium TaxID=754515 RepID=A0A6M4J9J2_9MOLU|nr:hypothetical protein [Mycoplasma miroungigenitalium]MBU4690519.1 hypothetical protein [Mycoplasma miroungigenitalium]MBU4691786.1 hypothetical protein [Mycoplasma miroungigenitalium]QJR43613.1 hypothetical protein HLA87_02325 [Mycoplasma miroungigenitalium]
MKTMLDVVSQIAYEHCKDGKYVEFNFLFNKVEKELKEKWEVEADEKGKEYDAIRVNKLGELYRLLTVDSNFLRNAKGQWTIRPGFEV